MRFPLDRQSSIPLSLQIKTHLRQAILSGGLEQGARLPSVRELAGSLFAWLRLPDPFSATALLPLACAEGVSFAPGPAFFGPGPAFFGPGAGAGALPGDTVQAGSFPPMGDRSPAGDEFLRPNFACHTPEEIEEGLRRLGKALG